MKKAFITVAGVCILTSSAFAGNISLVLRADADTTMANQAASDASTTNRDSTKYFLQTARLEYKGQMNEQLSFVTRLRFENVSSTTPNKTDNVTDTIDLMYINHKLAEDMVLTLGKLGTEILADDSVPFSDIYLSSRARADIAGAYLYATGIKLSKAFSNHEFKVMTFNQSESTSSDQTRSAYGIVYKSKLLDKTVFPTLSYHKDHRQSSISAQDPTVEMMAAGLKYDPKPYSVSFDYLQNTRDNMTGTGVTATAAASKKNILQTYLLDAAYQVDPQWLAKVRFDSSVKIAKDDLAHTESNTYYEGISLATEYKPFKDDMFRYHLAWTQLTEKPQAGPDLITQHIIFGAMIYADFLK